MLGRLPGDRLQATDGLPHNPVSRGMLPVHGRSLAGHVVGHRRPAERPLDQEQGADVLLDELRVLQSEREGVAGSSAMADQDQLLGSLPGDCQHLGTHQLGILLDRLLRIRLDEVDRRAGHAPGPELFDILREVSGHLLVEEAADEDIAVAACVATDLVRNLQLALARGVEPGAELLGRDARSGLSLDRRDEDKARSVKSPSTASSFKVR